MNNQRLKGFSSGTTDARYIYTEILLELVSRIEDSSVKDTTEKLIQKVLNAESIETKVDYEHMDKVVSIMFPDEKNGNITVIVNTDVDARLNLDTTNAYLDNHINNHYRPYMVLRGNATSVDIEIGDAIKGVVFDAKNTQYVKCNYEFTDAQIADLTVKGLFRDGFVVPDRISHYNGIKLPCKVDYIIYQPENEMPIIIVKVNDSLQLSTNMEKSRYNMAKYFEPIVAVGSMDIPETVVYEDNTYSFGQQEENVVSTSEEQPKFSDEQLRYLASIGYDLNKIGQNVRGMNKDVYVEQPKGNEYKNFLQSTEEFETEEMAEETQVDDVTEKDDMAPVSTEESASEDDFNNDNYIDGDDYIGEDEDASTNESESESESEYEESSQSNDEQINVESDLSVEIDTPDNEQSDVDTHTYEMPDVEMDVPVDVPENVKAKTSEERKQAQNNVGRISASAMADRAAQRNSSPGLGE